MCEIYLGGFLVTCYFLIIIGLLSESIGAALIIYPLWNIRKRTEEAIKNIHSEVTRLTTRDMNKIIEKDHVVHMREHAIYDAQEKHDDINDLIDKENIFVAIFKNILTESILSQTFVRIGIIFLFVGLAFQLIAGIAFDFQYRFPSS